MFNIHRSKAFFYLKAITFPPSPKPYPLFHQYPFLPFCTNTSHSPSFPVSYLIHNFGFSPQSASKLCSTHRLRFKTPEKPDSVISFFKNHGFSDTQLHHMIEKAPWLLSCDPYKRVLPKFEFFHSKGASTSDIVNLVSKYPFVLAPSLEKQIVPAYEFYYRFLKSDKDTIASLTIFNNSRRLARNVRMLIENGVTQSNIATLLRTWCNVFNRCENDMLKVVEELKDMGFDPSKYAFTTALRAKTSISKWKEKVDAFKKWGWSDEDIMEAFRRQPHCLVASVDKINLVMSFWVNHLGWDALALVQVPSVFGYSLERRTIPRATIVQFLLKKGLHKKNASLASPFIMSEKLFLDKYIKRFEEESSYLLIMYEEKLNCAYNMENTGMS